MTALVARHDGWRAGSRYGLDWRTLSLAVVIFFVSLSGAGAFVVVAVPLLVFCWLILTNVASRTRFDDLRFSHPAVLLCIFVGVVLTAKAISAVLAGTTTPDQLFTVETYRNRWIADMFWVALLFLVVLVFENTSRRSLQSAIRLVIAVHVAAFLLQFAVHYLFGHLLDFSQLLNGIPARTRYSTFFRPTGLFPEPSTFAGVMITLLACDALVSRKVSVRLSLLVAILCVISFSTAAWLFAGFLLLVLLPTTLKNKFMSGLALCGVIILLALVLLSSYGQAQISKFNQTAGMRGDIIAYTLSERPLWQNIAGPAANGASYDYLAKTGALMEGQAAMGSTSADGTAVYLFAVYGLMGLAAYLVFLGYTFRRLTFPIFLLVFLVTMTKMTPDFMQFTLLGAALCLELFPAKGPRAEGATTSSPDRSTV